MNLSFVLLLLFIDLESYIDLRSGVGRDALFVPRDVSN
jgi:hypothetical protein